MIGQLAKTVVYGGAALARLNNQPLCTYLAQPSDPLRDDDQPTLYVFADPANPELAYRIYADDDITAKMVNDSKIDSQQMTFILIHGWLGGIHNEFWLTEAKKAVLRMRTVGGRTNSTDYQSLPFKPNVIVVDWSLLAVGSLYVATQHSYAVSRRLGRLLRQLASVGGLRAQLMHCLGHSIGLHICGKAARLAFPDSIQAHSDLMSIQKMGRITGLDPGGFCYELDIKDESKFLGLRPSDALVTDAYYSNRSPFGNKFQVAQFNIRINNGFFQEPCSVWKNPEEARNYFRATVKFLFSTTNHNDILTCDHYFSTRISYETLDTPICSNVGYSCPTYLNYLKGRCGLCESKDQCYAMDFEYQRSRPSIEHAWRHLRDNFNFTRNFHHLAEPRSDQRADGISYDRRAIYYMRVNNGNSKCTETFRIRLTLDPNRQKLSFLRVASLKLRLIDAGGASIEVLDSSDGSQDSDISLHGPWNWDGRDPEAQLEAFGVDDRTLTALIEMPVGLSAEKFARDATVAALIDDEGQIGQETVEFVRVDYLSSSSRR